MRFHFHISDRQARNFLVVAIVIEICLVAAFLTDGMLGHPDPIVHKLFNLDGERNIPALFSSAQLFMLGIVFFSVAYQLRQKHFSSPLFFAVLGAAFIFLSFDEALSIHEGITSSLEHVEWIPRFKGNHGIWVAPYLLVGLVFFVSTLREFLKVWNQHRRESIIMASGCVIFLVGAVGLEVLSYQLLREGSSTRFLYQLEVAVEEFLEMMGISIILYGAIMLNVELIPRAGPNAD